MRVSEFTQKNENVKRVYSDIYLWTITATNPLSFRGFDCEIHKATWFEIKLLRKPKIIVRSENDQLIHKLIRMQELKDWFIESSFPLDNSFSLKNTPEGALIFTTFNTEYNSEEKIGKALNLIEVLASEIGALK